MLGAEFESIKNEIERLPSGGITYKTINGKKYAYYQWSESGKQHARRVKDDELEILSEAIARRKELKSQLQGAKNYNWLNEACFPMKLREAGNNTYAGLSGQSEERFSCSVRLGEELRRFAQPVAKWKRRECFGTLHEYIYDDTYDKVYILYGLRRTGKTTLIRQILLDMDEDVLRRAAFIQVKDGLTMADINRDLKYLEKAGYKYVFIDEVTLMDDFIGGAALFSDIFAASGMKIVLSGTDSLGFVMAEDEELYDRCIMSHTTFISYREFERVLGINGIDEYILYGGTMSLSGRRYNDRIFSSEKSTGEYVDSAIVHNIQHSLKNYDNQSHFGVLYELYCKGELTSAINRVVEDVNHRFTLEVLTHDWRSNDIRISATNLRKDAANPTDVLDDVDIDEQLKELLEIRNRDEQLVELDEAAASWIREYMDLLDLTVDIKTRFTDNFNHVEKRTALTQPGLRYSQADALIKTLINDNKFRELSLAERNRIIERIRNEIKGRMLEDIVLLETMMARPDAEVFGLKFAVGEFDMVVFDTDNACCEIYEIKHSDKVVPAQCTHLLDEEKCKVTEFRYGAIKGKYVLYRGETTSLKKAGYPEREDISYLNVEEYLKGLGVIEHEN